MKKQDELQPALQSRDNKMSRKGYHKPALTQYDDLRTVTLGNSPGGQESLGGGIILLKRAGSMSSPFDGTDGSSPVDEIIGGGG